jgi:hypothetical protein
LTFIGLIGLLTFLSHLQNCLEILNKLIVALDLGGLRLHQVLVVDLDLLLGHKRFDLGDEDVGELGEVLRVYLIHLLSYCLD